MVAPDLAFNTAASFATNTNWQAYGGETTLSYLTQMMGLTVQNFVSAATGMAILSRSSADWPAGMRRPSEISGPISTRSTLYILLPLVAASWLLVLVSQGVVQTFDAYQTATLTQPVVYEKPVMDASGQPVLDEQGKPKTESATATEQVLAVGPAASQIAIKQLGTNGGGFFNVNSAHPFENPTPLSNFLEILAILLIPAALCYTFGVMVGDTRQGWAILAAMTMILMSLHARLGSLGRTKRQSAFTAIGVDQHPSGGQAGRQHGGQRGPIRHRQLRPVVRRDDRRVQRLRQFHA